MIQSFAVYKILCTSKRKWHYFFSIRNCQLLTLKILLGQAFVVDKYNRPMPKLRNTTPETGRYEERPAPPGTLNVAQLRQIILLYHGKAEDHNGPMDVNQIAEKFRVDVAQVQRMVQFLSLPPENANKHKIDPR